MSRDRVAKAPAPAVVPPEDISPPSGDTITSPSSKVITAPKAHRSAPAPSEPEQHVIDALVDYDQAEDLFKVHWHGYLHSDDTWEPPGHLPFNAMVAYFRRLGKRLPRHLRHFNAKN